MERARDGKFADSPLEGDGFEPSVPDRQSVIGAHRAWDFADARQEGQGFEPSVLLITNGLPPGRIETPSPRRLSHTIWIRVSRPCRRPTCRPLAYRS